MDLINEYNALLTNEYKVLKAKTQQLNLVFYETLTGPIDLVQIIRPFVKTTFTNLANFSQNLAENLQKLHELKKEYTEELAVDQQNLEILEKQEAENMQQIDFLTSQKSIILDKKHAQQQLNISKLQALGMPFVTDKTEISAELQNLQTEIQNFKEIITQQTDRKLEIDLKLFQQSEKMNDLKEKISNLRAENQKMSSVVNVKKVHFGVQVTERQQQTPLSKMRNLPTFDALKRCEM